MIFKEPGQPVINDLCDPVVFPFCVFVHDYTAAS